MFILRWNSSGRSHSNIYNKFHKLSKNLYIEIISMPVLNPLDFKSLSKLIYEEFLNLSYLISVVVEKKACFD